LRQDVSPTHPAPPLDPLPTLSQARRSALCGTPHDCIAVFFFVKKAAKTVARQSALRCGTLSWKQTTYGDCHLVVRQTRDGCTGIDHVTAHQRRFALGLLPLTLSYVWQPSGIANTPEHLTSTILQSADRKFIISSGTAYGRARVSVYW